MTNLIEAPDRSSAAAGLYGVDLSSDASSRPHLMQGPSPPSNLRVAPPENAAAGAMRTRLSTQLAPNARRLRNEVASCENGVDDIVPA